MLSSPLRSDSLPSSQPLSLAAGCPLWDASHARFGTPLCAAQCGWVGCVSVMLCVLLVMDMSLRLTSGLGDALPSTVLLLCILVKGSTTQHHSCESALSRSTPSGQTQTSKTYPCHRTHAKCP